VSPFPTFELAMVMIMQASLNFHTYENIYTTMKKSRGLAQMVRARRVSNQDW
jgi:hypothetical protein